MNKFTIAFVQAGVEQTAEVAVNDDQTSVDAINKLMTLKGIKAFQDINSCVPAIKTIKDDISFFTFMSNLESRFAHSTMEANAMLSTILHETFNVIPNDNKHSFWKLPSVLDIQV